MYDCIQGPRVVCFTHFSGTHPYVHKTQDMHAVTAPHAERLAIAAASQLANHAAGQPSTPIEPQDTQRLRTLLWNRGVSCFNAHLHQRASMLYHATQAWEGEMVDRCRALALCCMCCNDTQGYAGCYCLVS